MKPPITTDMFSDEALDLVIEYISPILNQLPSGMIIMVENLFPRDVWAGTSDYTHRVIGMQVIYLANKVRIRLEPLHDEREAIQRHCVK